MTDSTRTYGREDLGRLIQRWPILCLHTLGCAAVLAFGLVTDDVFVDVVCAIGLVIGFESLRRRWLHAL